MALETTTFSGELDKLDESHKKFLDSAEALQKFNISPEFLDELATFETLLTAFSRSFIGLVEAAETVVGLHPNEAEAVKGIEEGQGQTTLPTGERWSWWRFAAVALVNVATYVAVEQRILSFQFFEFVVVFSIVLMFLPQVADLIHRLIGRGEEEEEEKAQNMRLEDWVSTSISEMREKYKSTRFLCMVQNQTPESLPQYRALEIPEAMYVRSRQEKEKLPHEFNDRIDRIVMACSKNEWIRRSLIIMAIVQAKQSVNAMAPRGGGPT